MLNRLILTVLPVSIFVLFSCKKDQSNQPPAVKEPAFVVVLDRAYMPGNKIDSAFALWEVNGQKQSVKLLVSNDMLKDAIRQFQEGNGKLTLHLFTAIKF
ncbi:MAG TPA: hypothetical protein VER36_08490 [Flavisolibacter sp.]|nr:hypothetical protein [Flavisolibacter sp.]